MSHNVVFISVVQWPIDTFPKWDKRGRPLDVSIYRKTFSSLKVCYVKVAADSLDTIKSHASGNLIASGCADGAVHILELGSTLCEPLPQEKALMLQVSTCIPSFSEMILCLKSRR